MRCSVQLFTGMIALSLLFTSGAFGQEEEEGHYFAVTTWKFDIPEDGTQAEFDQMMKEWSDKITKKNDKIISQRVMRHRSGGDSRDLVIVTEYASWNDIGAAQEMQNKLVEAAWPDEEARRAHMRKFGRYLLHHSDEIYMGLPALGK